MISLKEFSQFKVSPLDLETLDTIKGGRISCDALLEVLDYLSGFPDGSNENEQGKVVTALYANGTYVVTPKN